METKRPKWVPVSFTFDDHYDTDNEKIQEKRSFGKPKEDHRTHHEINCCLATTFDKGYLLKNNEMSGAHLFHHADEETDNGKKSDKTDEEAKVNKSEQSNNIATPTTSEQAKLMLSKPDDLEQTSLSMVNSALKKNSITSKGKILEVKMTQEKNPFRGDVYIEYLKCLAYSIKTNHNLFSSTSIKVREKDHISVFLKLNRHLLTLKLALESINSMHNITLHYILLIDKALNIVGECIEKDQSGKYINLRYLYFRIKRVERLLSEIYSSRFKLIFSDEILQPGMPFEKKKLMSAITHKGQLTYYKTAMKCPIQKMPSVKKEATKPRKNIVKKERTESQPGNTLFRILGTEKTDELIEEAVALAKKRIFKLHESSSSNDLSAGTSSGSRGGRSSRTTSKLVNICDSIEIIKSKKRSKPSVPKRKTTNKTNATKMKQTTEKRVKPKTPCSVKNKERNAPFIQCYHHAKLKDLNTSSSECLSTDTGSRKTTAEPVKLRKKENIIRTNKDSTVIWKP